MTSFASDALNSKLPYAFGNELTWLRNAAKDFKQAVMIGAGPGVMAMALMEGNPDLNLLVIDIATCHYTKAHLDEQNIHSVAFAVADSTTYEYKGPKLDFLLVDGDHTFEGVVRDVVNWIEHVKSGGLIFFHDFEIVNDDETNGVRDAIDDLLEDEVMRADKVGTPGISVVYRKK